jgi:hypothetical protein
MAVYHIVQLSAGLKNLHDYDSLKAMGVENGE